MDGVKHNEVHEGTKVREFGVVSAAAAAERVALRMLRSDESGEAQSAALRH